MNLRTEPSVTFEPSSAPSGRMYGVGESGSLDETSSQNPQTSYAKSKVVAERGILEMVDSAFRPIGFRFATAYGFSPRPRLDIVVNNLVACAISRGELVLESDGTPWRPLIHVKDMARAIAASLESDSELTGGHAFNVGCDEENYQVRDIAGFISNAFCDVPLRIGVASASDTRSYRVSFKKFAAAFASGVPQERLSTAISEIAKQYSDSLDRNDYEAARFFRLRQIRSLIEARQLDADLRWTAESAYV